MESFCPDGSVRVPGKLCSRRMTDDDPSEIDAAGDVDITAKKTISSPIENAIAKANTSTVAKASSNTAPTMKSRTQQRAFAFTPRPVKTSSKLTPIQIENAKLVSISYIIDAQMQGADGTVADAFIDGSETLIMNGMDDYTMLESLSTKDYVVVTRDQETKIVFRGKQDDSDMPHAKRVITGQARDYTELDDLYQRLNKLNPGGDIEIVSYSNGTPKGLYLSETYNLKHFAIDGLLGPLETKALINRAPGAAPLELMKTTNTGVSSPGITAAQTALGREITNTTITEIQPVKTLGKNPLRRFVANHDLQSTYANQDPRNRPLSEEDRVPRLRNRIGGGLAAGIVPGLIANLAVGGLAPEDTPQETKIVESAIVTSALTKGISPLLGAGAAGMSETLLPIYASFQAADKAGQVVDRTLPADINPVAKGAIEGGVSGAAGGAAFGVAQVGQRVAGRAIAQGVAQMAQPAFYGAVATSEEMAMVAEGAVVAEEVGLGAAALLGAEAGAVLTSELGPLSLVGAAVGAGLGLIGAVMASKR